MSFSPAAERNKAAILEVLERLLPATASVLEIASGTGQHAAHFAAEQAHWAWQPSDAETAALASIEQHTEGLANVRPPLLLDVLATAWPVAPAGFDAVYCANMLHIAPWLTCAALMAGAVRSLRPGGVLVLYGPYLVEGEPLAASNAGFDADLRTRNPLWGLRSLASVAAAASAAGLAFEQRWNLPANNLVLSFRRPPPAAAAGQVPQKVR